LLKTKNLKEWCMANLELQDLITTPTEREELELKSWMDVTENVNKAKLARHIAAIANHGGGHIVFGFNDDGTRCEPHACARTAYAQDNFAAIIKKYLRPKFQCTVHFEEKDGVLHPILWIPSHGISPIIAETNGPEVKGKPEGVVSGQIYIRSPQPESVSIGETDLWDKLINRCVLARRDELLSQFSSILSVANIAPSDKEDKTATLKQWHDALRTAFLKEIRSKNISATYPLADNNVQFSYMLKGTNKASVELDDLLNIVRRVNGAVRDTVRYGWSMFHLFTRPEIAPCFTTDPTIEDRDFVFLQTSLLDNSRVGAADFWRISPDGRVSLIRDFHEDRYENAKEKVFDPWLHIRDITEFVRHARAFAEEFQ